MLPANNLDVSVRTPPVVAPALPGERVQECDEKAPIGNKAIEGSIWVIGATGAAKALGFACQLALAWFLTKKDYGVYAIAISLSVFLSVLRDGGLPMVLERKGSQFESYAGPVFWMMLAMNIATGMLIALIAAPAARLYHIPELASVITLFAATIPLSVLPAILSVRLALDLKFRELGLVQVVSSTLRNGLLLFFAWAGFGARSFLLPVLITSVTDSLLLWMVTRYSPWAMPPQFRLWPELFASGRWVLLGTFSIALGNNGAYFLLGEFFSSDVVGTYFFAYQLVVQLGVLLSDNVYQVLVPSFVRMGPDILRIRAAVLRALSLVVVIGAVASLSIAAVYEPLERVLWHGKWAAASGSVHILAIVWPAAAGVSVLRALQMATGHFRQWGIVTLIGALASVSGTAIGAYFGKSAAGAALGFSLGSLFGAALNARIALPRIGIRAADTAISVLRPWLIIVVAAVCAQLAGSRFDRTWIDILVTAACLCTLGLFGLRLFANESLRLVEISLRQIIRGNFRSTAHSEST